jgi:hypothetical protein
MAIKIGGSTPQVPASLVLGHQNYALGIASGPSAASEQLAPGVTLIQHAPLVSSVAQMIDPGYVNPALALIPPAAPYSGYSFGTGPGSFDVDGGDQDEGDESDDYDEGDGQIFDTSLDSSFNPAREEFMGAPFTSKVPLSHAAVLATRAKFNALKQKEAITKNAVKSHVAKVAATAKTAQNLATGAANLRPGAAAPSAATRAKVSAASLRGDLLSDLNQDLMNVLDPLHISDLANKVESGQTTLVGMGEEILGECMEILGDSASDLAAMDAQMQQMQSALDSLNSQDATLQNQIMDAQPVWQSYAQSLQSNAVLNSQYGNNQQNQFAMSPGQIQQQFGIPSYNPLDPVSVLALATATNYAPAISVCNNMISLQQQDAMVQQQAQTLSNQIDNMNTALNTYTQNLGTLQAQSQTWQATMSQAQSMSQGIGQPAYQPTAPGYDPTQGGAYPPGYPPSYGGGYDPSQYGYGGGYADPQDYAPQESYGPAPSQYYQGPQTYIPDAFADESSDVDAVDSGFDDGSDGSDF